MSDYAPWSVEALKNTVLVGIPQSFKGTPFPPFLYTMALDEAKAWLRTRFHIEIPVAEYTDRLDFRQGDLGRWFLMPMGHRPFVRVKKLAFQFGPSEVINVPTDWIIVTNKPSGVLQIVPTAAAAVPFQGTELALRYFNSLYATVPGWYALTYDAGVEADQLPDDLLMIGYKRAAMLVLQHAGTLVAGAGVASKSIGMDGLSSNINTTKTGSGGAFQSHINLFQQMIQEDADRIYRNLHGFQVRTV